MKTKASSIGSSCSSLNEESRVESIKPRPDVDKAMKARQVFGDSVMLDEFDEDDTFFTYTPSPPKPPVADRDEQIYDGVATKMPQEPIELAPSNRDAELMNSQISDSSVGADQEETKESASFGDIKPPAFSRPSGLQGTEGKENTRNSVMQKNFLSRVDKSGETSAPRSRSSLSSDLVQKTQEAINRATLSLSQATKPNQKNLNPKSEKPPKDKKIKNERDDWLEDLEEAKEFYRDMHKKRFETLKQQRQLSSLVSKEKAALDEMRRSAKLRTIDEESQFKSSVFREQQKLRRENEERRHRESIEARNKLRKNAIEGVERLQVEKQQEDNVIFDDRNATSEAIRKSKRDAAYQRRKSYQFRNGDARRIRNLHAQMQVEKMTREKESYELEREAAKDVDKFLNDLEKERRESYAKRNEHARRVRQDQMEDLEKSQSRNHENFELERAASKDVDDAKRQKAKEIRESLATRNRAAREYREKKSKEEGDAMEEQQKSFELKRAADRDVDEYEKRRELERRESLLKRGKDFIHQRDRKEEELTKEKEAKHVSFEVKRESEKDVERYLQEQQAERRASLANRNKERSRHVKVMEELELIARERETESYVLKWAAESDVKNFMAKTKEERKQSLEQRGKEKMRIRELEEQNRRQEIEQAHQDATVRASDHIDVEEYKRKCVERDRTSLEYRGKEARKQRLEESETLRQERKQEEARFELDSLSRKDVEDYVNSCKERRRYSLAFRAKEKRIHYNWKEKQENEDKKERNREIRARLMDRRYMEMAEQQTRAAQTLEAIRHLQRLYGNKKDNSVQGLPK